MSDETDRWFEWFCLIFLGTIVLGMAWFFITLARQPHLERDEPYVTELLIGAPIAEVGECYARKRSSGCMVRQAGGKWVARNLGAWPGRPFQVGQRMGVQYHVGAEVVEDFNWREGERTVGARGACFKTDPDCWWPSKSHRSPQ